MSESWLLACHDLLFPSGPAQTLSGNDGPWGPYPGQCLAPSRGLSAVLTRCLPSIEVRLLLSPRMIIDVLKRWARGRFAAVSGAVVSFLRTRGIRSHTWVLLDEEPRPLIGPYVKRPGFFLQWRCSRCGWLGDDIARKPFPFLPPDCGPDVPMAIRGQANGHSWFSFTWARKTAMTPCWLVRLRARLSI